MKITAPYNFVPLNQQVFYPDWAEQVTQDLPFSDAEDGVIEVKLRNVSPLFTRDGAKNDFSAHTMRADGKRQYFIPATTIKGMLREIVEIMSFGKMQEDKDYQNRTFGYRDVANKKNKAKSIEYLKKINKGKPGWLTLKEEKYYFTPCDGEIDKIPFAEVTKRFPSYKSDGSIWKSNVSVETDKNKYPTYPEIEKNDFYYQIVCTGKMQGKQNEMLFPSNRGESIEISKETIKAFKIIYDGTPGFAKEKDGNGCFMTALEKGYEIPVFYLALPNGQVTLGLSRTFKLPFQYNVRQQVEFIQKAAPEKQDLGEILFGYAGKEESLKGRVQVSHAFMIGTVDDADLVNVKGVLGTPKASYYPLYIKQKSNPYKTYDDAEGIAGRKLYRIHSKNSTTQLPQANSEKNNVETTFKAIPQGHTFTLRISLHNTKATEIGAILSALTFNLTSGVYFNLGMAKSFGYGKCAITKEDVTLRGFTHNMEHYIHCFEEMMSVFTYETYQQMWVQTESITQLVNILSEHDDSEVKMMILDEYTVSKDESKSTFNKLSEKGNPIHSLLTDEEKEKVRNQATKVKEERGQKEIRNGHKADYQEAQHFIDAGNYQKAKDKYNEIIDDLMKHGIICDEENRKITEIELLITARKADEQKMLDEQAKLQKQEKLAAGLGAILEKMAGNGVDYSIKEFKVCFQKVEKWLKDSGSQQLSEQDTIALYNTSIRLLESPSKKEVKELNKPFEIGNIWKKLSSYLSQDMAKELLEKYNK